MITTRCLFTIIFQQPTCYQIISLNYFVIIHGCIVILENQLSTHTVEAPSNKTLAITKSTNMGIWVAVTSNQLFVRGS